MKANSGASKDFITKSDATILTNIRQLQSTSIMLPNKIHVSTTMTGTLPLSQALSHTALKVHALPGIIQFTLIHRSTM